MVGSEGALLARHCVPVVQAGLVGDQVLVTVVEDVVLVPHVRDNVGASLVVAPELRHFRNPAAAALLPE